MRNLSSKTGKDVAITDTPFRGNGPAVNARELWKFLKSKRKFADWIKSRINEYGFCERLDYAIHKNVKRGEDGRDFTPFWAKSHGRQSKEYFISLDMAKELTMV